MTKDDLKFPTNTQNINPGKYVISDVNIDFTTTVDFVSTDDDGDDGDDGDGDDGAGAIGVPARRTLKTLTYIPPTGPPQVWYRSSELEALVSAVQSEAQAAAGPVAPDETRPQARRPSFTPPAGTAEGGSEKVLNGGGFKFNFDTNTFSLEGDSRYNVDGDFEVGYNDSDGSTEISYRPQVNFLGGAMGSTALDVRGKVDISGTVNGKAAIAAGGDIEFSSGADATASTAQPLVVYSGGSIKIIAASNAENFLLKGLIYADNDFDLVKLNESSAPLQNVEFQGAIIAQSGKISMGDSQVVSFVYDPKYIEAFTYGLPNNRRRLKQAAFIIH